MPIVGLTNQGIDFPIIGAIRKGGPKQQKARRDGSTYEVVGRDLDHFRVEFDEEEQEAAQAFLEAYGPEPKQLDILLPFDLDRCWVTWKESYTHGTLVHRCDGALVQYAVDPESGAVTVRDGLSTATGQPVKCSGIAYTTRTGEPVPCKEVGRLRVILPALRRFACLVVHTGSKWDVSNLDKQLRGIQSAAGGNLVGVPLVLRRRVREISQPRPDGKRQRVRKSLLSVEADPLWVQKRLHEFQAALQPAHEPAPQLPRLESPGPAGAPAPERASRWEEAGWEEDEWDEGAGEIIEGEEEEGHPLAAPPEAAPPPITLEQFVQDKRAWRGVCSEAGKLRISNPNDAFAILVGAGLRELTPETAAQAVAILKKHAKDNA